MSTAKYTHNPYLAKVVDAFVEDDVMATTQRSGLSDSGASIMSRSSSPAVQQADVEEGMGRRSTSKYYEALSPMLPFFEYSTTTEMLRREEAERMGLERLFVGQVPYHLEAGHVAMMIEVLTGRRPLLVEKIVRWTQSRKPCGCFHVYCCPEEVDAILCADQTTLCEEEGFWVANDSLEKQVLVDHCKLLQDNKDARAPLMPYQLMTVQRATSSYQRPKVDAFTNTGRRNQSAAYTTPRKASRQQQQQPAHFSAVHGMDAPNMFPTHANRIW